MYLKAMDRKRWSFPQVGVAAARSGSGTRVALAGVAPIPWLLAAGGRRLGDAAAADGLEGRRRAGARPARGRPAAPELDKVPARNADCGSSSSSPSPASRARSRWRRRARQPDGVVRRAAPPGAAGEGPLALEPLPDPVEAPPGLRARGERHRLPAVDARRRRPGRVAAPAGRGVVDRTLAGCSR